MKKEKGEFNTLLFYYIYIRNEQRERVKNSQINDQFVRFLLPWPRLWARI